MQKLTLPIFLYIFLRTLQFGALNINSGKLVVLENCTFSDSLGYPAGVYMYGGALLMNGNSFFRNKGSGGGSIAVSIAHVDANCNKFEENEADEGAAFYLSESSLYAKLNTFTGNKAYYGGAIMGLYSAIMTNADSFTNNSAELVSSCCTRLFFQIILLTLSLTDIVPCFPVLERS
jgi:hypothetical protein